MIFVPPYRLHPRRRQFGDGRSYGWSWADARTLMVSESWRVGTWTSRQ